MTAYYERLGELFQFHDIVDDPQEVTPETVEELTLHFQSEANLYVDGIIGPNTLWALQAPFFANKAQLDIVKVLADDAPDGIEALPNFTLREDAAPHFREIAKAMDTKGALLLSSGGVRSLSAQANASRSTKSMHYPGLAIDLCITAGFFNPHQDPYVITANDDQSWTVWARATGGEDQELEAVYWQGPWTGGRVSTMTLEDKFINITALCAEHGFHPIRPRASFLRPRNKSYLSSEWWHFQAEGLLVPEISQLGPELLRIKSYDALRIESRNPHLWANHRCIFKKTWW